MEDDFDGNARHYPRSMHQPHRHGGNRRRRHGRRAVHRYPHKTHQRRVTEHSLGDQGPTHYGQQHPYHPRDMTGH